ncbi:MAG: hypothetical protein CME70_18685 [Halobacteriovorax sp.]|nr:hypothetical protein [Halobacteriovorax sp.]|tara:strand:- start:102 stop:365 length:264 start_codon:yes stop_codon:yes gene_type:complete
MSAQTYGKSSTEKQIEDNAVAREITQTILLYGVSQQQILRIAYLLSLELEDRESMIKISECVKQFLDSIDNISDDVKSSKSNILTTE